ncbi:hypothetical protein [Aeromicrobium endophyticum]|uniref:Core-binding (CB) domain-containing protein n=1 Tax=Aeromicrobium endophyticum TaxID=2292704 RepID=A0A371P1Z7_9ACTN|nr:hypothetical protein [Aeromicrobium endophyticum]REK69921.1 hypothetical protein DX116_12070 [Aeromicrobium endophyticum]
MDADEPGWPMIDDFFRDLAVGRSAATARRYLRVRARLYAFLETADLSGALGADAATVLQAERQRHDSGAFWAVLGVGELARCLPAFAGDPWLPDGLAEARVHLSVVSRLAARLGDSPGRHDVHAAVDLSRELLDVRPSATEPPRMPDRFLRRPGPSW